MSVSKLLEKNLKISTKSKTTEPKSINPRINQTAREYGNTRAEKDLALLDVKLKTAQMNYEILVKNVIPREEIQHIWNKIINAATYFQDYGQRYSQEWGSALGISDPDKIDDLRKMIDISTETFMSSFVETVVNEI